MLSLKRFCFLCCFYAWISCTNFVRNFVNSTSITLEVNNISPDEAISLIDASTGKHSSILMADSFEYSFSNSNILPPLWDEVKELSSNNFPLDSEGRLIVNVWDYAGRMALYKFLIENIKNCAWNLNLKSSDAFIPQKLRSYYPNNIIWGLPLQHGWQFSSNRLFTSANSTIISPDAWWGCMNYYLAVIPYLGAVRAGVAPAIALAYNPDQSVFCDSYESCPGTIDPWFDFFTYVNATANSCPESTLGHEYHTPLVEKLDFNLTSAMENLLDLLWKAHINSIDTALPLFEEKLALMSPQEARFGTSWAGLVDLIADTRFPCNMLYTDLLQNLLPPRILVGDDHPPKISDMSRLQNRAIVLIDGIQVANEVSDGAVSNLWSRMMCSEENRALGREMIALGLYRPVVLVEDYQSLRKTFPCQ